VSYENRDRRGGWVISCYSPALNMEAIRTSETSVQTRATRCYIPEDDISHSHRRGNLKSYTDEILIVMFSERRGHGLRQ
jgi:hypothetical protein